MKKLTLLTLATLLIFSASAVSQENHITRIKIGNKIEVSIDEANKKILTIDFQANDGDAHESIDTTIVGEDTIVTIKRIHTVTQDDVKHYPIIIDGDTILTQGDINEINNSIDTLVYTIHSRFDSVIYDAGEVINVEELDEFSMMDEEFEEQVEEAVEASEDAEMEIQVFSDDESDEDDNKSKFEGHWAGFEFGFIGLTRDQELLGNDYAFSNRPFRSWNFAINLIPVNIPIIAENFGIVTGVGMGWKNYHFANNYLMESDQDGVQFSPLPSGDSKITKNRLSTFYLSIPVAFELQFPIRHNKDKVFIMAGAYGNLRLDSDYRYEIETNGVSEKQSMDGDFFLSDFEYGLTARVGFDHLNFFANYSLNDMFRENSGPDVQPITVGMMVVPFY